MPSRSRARTRAETSPLTPDRSQRGPVLLASDGRGATNAPALAARLVADRLGVGVEVVSVLTPLPVAYTAAEGLPLPPDFERHRVADLREAVRQWLEPVLGPRDSWPLDVRYGSPGRAIADAARERGASVIVVGTGGHRRIDRLLGEEVSLQVVRHASTPVLAVTRWGSRPPRRVVVGVDFSAASIDAARTAIALLDDHAGAPALVSLVHARPTAEAWSGVHESSIGELFARLGDLLRPGLPADATLDVRTRPGRVVNTLLDAADELGADLVAVGTHGPGWVERLFVGSVATSLLRAANLNVLVAPTPRPAERVRLELRVSGRVALHRPDDWAAALDAFTRRNASRRARLEVDDPVLRGFVISGEQYRLRGATYDPHDERASLVLGTSADPLRDLTHTTGKVRAVEVAAAPSGHAESLVVTDDHGDAVLTVTD